LYALPENKETFGNAWASYKAAGFTQYKTGIKNACKVLQLKCIQEYLTQLTMERKQAEAKDKTKEVINKDWVVGKLKEIHGKAITKNDLTSATRAIELIGKTEAVFTDNLNTTDLAQIEQLNEAEQAEAQRLAKIRLMQA